MFLELMATIFGGIGAAGVVMLLNRLLGGRLPRWLAPVGAGAAMIATTISMEYSWYGRTVDNLPEGLVVAQAVEQRAFYQPWTYAVPYVNRFVAVDMATMRTHPERPDQRLADLYFFGRWSAVDKLPVATDCDGRRRAMLADGIDFDADGSVAGANWIALSGPDPVLDTICETV